jgi:hypothetical protein
MNGGSEKKDADKKIQYKVNIPLMREENGGAAIAMKARP